MNTIRQRVRELLVGTLLAFVVLSVAVPQMAHAGTSFVYLQAGQAEPPQTNPCAVNANVGGSNNAPYTVQDCGLPGRDSPPNNITYFHFTIPNDYNTAVSANAGVNITFFPETDNTVATDGACWGAAITVFPSGAGAANYRTASQAGLTSNLTGVLGIGQYLPVAQNIATVPITNAITGIACASTDCNNREAILQVQRVACSGGTALTGTAALLKIDISYST